MGQAIDLTGQTFGKLIVKEKTGSTKAGVIWTCECECGATTTVAAARLRNGDRTSCGANACLKGRNKSDTEPITQTPEWKAWDWLKRTPNYPQEWEDFQKFITDIGQRPSDEYELARHDIREQHSNTNTYWRNPKLEREQREQLTTPPEFGISMRALWSNSYSTPTTAA